MAAFQELGNKIDLVQDENEMELIARADTPEADPISIDSIAAKLLRDNWLLTAFQFHKELIKSGRELPRFREFFSNPANFERMKNAGLEPSSPSGLFLEVGSDAGDAGGAGGATFNVADICNAELRNEEANSEVPLTVEEVSIAPVSERQSVDEEEMELEEVRQEFEEVVIQTNRSTQESYSMRRIPRGHCLIVNIENFQDKSKCRPGSRTDCERLENTFQKELKFLVKTVFDCKSTDLEELLQDYQAKDHSPYDCFVLVLMSHGREGYITTNDGERYPIKNIMEMFNGKNCPSLEDKPKLLIIQACRGESAIANADKTDPWAADAVGIPAMCDFVLAMATLKGYKAYIHPSDGSWFIQSLCDVLDEQWESLHLADMLVEVNKRVSDEMALVKDKNGFIRFYKQCTDTSNRLRKAIWFERVDDNTDSQVAEVEDNGLSADENVADEIQLPSQEAT